MMISVGGSGGTNPWRSSRISQRMSEAYSAATLTASSMRGQTSQIRSSTVGLLWDGRMSHHSSLLSSMKFMRW